MAIWQVSEIKEGTKLEVLYKNLQNGSQESCGEVASKTPTADIVAFCVDQGFPGDLISFGGRIFQFHRFSAKA